MPATPDVGQTYRARDLPPRSVVVTSTGTEYVRCTRIDSVMRWGQPIPGSGEWLVRYAYTLPEGEDMTEREKREVEAARFKMGGRPTRA
jgi:hypothetical protein